MNILEFNHYHELGDWMQACHKQASTTISNPSPSSKAVRIAASTDLTTVVASMHKIKYVDDLLSHNLEPIPDIDNFLEKTTPVLLDKYKTHVAHNVKLEEDALERKKKATEEYKQKIVEEQTLYDQTHPPVEEKAESNVSTSDK